jgi:hypothetical protein
MWFNEESSKLVNQRKQAEFSCLQNPNRMNGDDLNNIRRKSIRGYANKTGISETGSKNNSKRV